MHWRRAWQPTAVFFPEILWTEEPGRLQSTGSTESNTTEATYHACMRIRRTYFVLNCVKKLTCISKNNENTSEIRKGLLNLKNICTAKETLKETLEEKDNLRIGKILADEDTHKEFVSKHINSTCSSISEIQTTSLHPINKRPEYKMRFL